MALAKLWLISVKHRKPVNATYWNINFLTVLPLWSCPILFLAPSQSHTPLPQVIELPPPSPTSTEGPDPTESDYTASSSSSFSFTSSSSFYATSSSSSTSDKVSWMATLKKGETGFHQLVWKHLAFLIHSPCVNLPPPQTPLKRISPVHRCSCLLSSIWSHFSSSSLERFPLQKMGWPLEWLRSLRFASLWRRCKVSTRGQTENVITFDECKKTFNP